MKNIYFIIFLLFSNSVFASQEKIENKNCFNVQNFIVKEVLSNGDAIAKDYSNKVSVLLPSELYMNYYDEMIVNPINNKCFIQKGTYKYENRYGENKTIPILELEDKYINTKYIMTYEVRKNAFQRNGFWYDEYNNLISGKVKFDSSLIRGEYNVINGLENGPFVNYRGNTVEIEGTYKDGKLDGLYKSYYENGNLKREENYKDGELDGIAKWYHENGNIGEEKNYKNGKLDGGWKIYYENGNLKREGIVNNGKDIGIVKRYYKNGKIYSEDNLETEIINYYDEDGNLKAVIDSKESKIYDKNHNVVFMWDKKNIYDKDGNILENDVIKKYIENNLKGYEGW